MEGAGWPRRAPAHHNNVVTTTRTRTSTLTIDHYNQGDSSALCALPGVLARVFGVKEELRASRKRFAGIRNDRGLPKVHLAGDGRGEGCGRGSRSEKLSIQGGSVFPAIAAFRRAEQCTQMAL